MSINVNLRNSSYALLNPSPPPPASDVSYISQHVQQQLTGAHTDYQHDNQYHQQSVTQSALSPDSSSNLLPALQHSAQSSPSPVLTGPQQLKVLTDAQPLNMRPKKRRKREEKSIETFRSSLVQHMRSTNAHWNPQPLIHDALATDGAVPDEHKPQPPPEPSQRPPHMVDAEWYAAYEERIATYDIRLLTRQSVIYNFDCSEYIILVPHWHALREALWQHLRDLNIKKAKRSVSTKRDLVEICLQADVRYDFSQFVKDATSHGNCKEALNAEPAAAVDNTTTTIASSGSSSSAPTGSPTLTQHTNSAFERIDKPKNYSKWQVNTGRYVRQRDKPKTAEGSPDSNATPAAAPVPYVADVVDGSSLDPVLLAANYVRSIANLSREQLRHVPQMLMGQPPATPTNHAANVTTPPRMQNLHTPANNTHRPATAPPDAASNASYYSFNLPILQTPGLQPVHNFNEPAPLPNGQSQFAYAPSPFHTNTNGHHQQHGALPLQPFSSPITHHRLHANEMTPPGRQVRRSQSSDGSGSGNRSGGRNSMTPPAGRHDLSSLYGTPQFGALMPTPMHPMHAAQRVNNGDYDHGGLPFTATPLISPLISHSAQRMTRSHHRDSMSKLPLAPLNGFAATPLKPLPPLRQEPVQQNGLSNSSTPTELQQENMRHSRAVQA